MIMIALLLPSCSGLAAVIALATYLGYEWLSSLARLGANSSLGAR